MVVRNRYQEDTCDLHQFVCKKNHMTTDYIMMNNNCVMNDCDNVCPYKVDSILAKSAKFIFQHSFSLSASVFTHTYQSTKIFKLKNG